MHAIVRRVLDASPGTSWADPGYFSGRSVSGNAARVLVQMIKPPPGHRTVPTLPGLILIVLSLGIGTAAYNTASNILFLTLSLLLSTLVLSGLVSWENFRGLRWRLLLDPHLRVGEAAPVRIELTNTKRHLPSHGLVFKTNAPRSAATGRLILDGRLDPGETRRLDWILVPKARGKEIVRLDGVESAFPFGFLRKLLPGRCEVERPVWPFIRKRWVVPLYEYARIQNGSRTGSLASPSKRTFTLTFRLLPGTYLAHA